MTKEKQAANKSVFKLGSIVRWIGAEGYGDVCGFIIKYVPENHGGSLATYRVCWFQNDAWKRSQWAPEDWNYQDDLEAV